MSAHFLRFVWYLKKAIDGILGFPAVPLQCVAWRFSDFDELPLHMAPL
jgi:hypothetical protein